MNAAPSVSQPLREISVVAPVNEALERMMRILFRPFDLGKWFIIGFTAWLALLGESGGGNFNFNTGGGGGRSGSGTNVNVRHELEQAKDFVMANLHWIIPVAVGIAVLGIALWVLFTWLNCRGKFMFLHCVALNRPEVSIPWRRFAPQGNSLFRFRIALGLGALVAMLPLLIAGGVIGAGMLSRSRVETAGVLWIIVLILALIGLALVFGLIAKLTTDFVVPIQFVQGCRCLEGWAILRGLLGAHVGSLLLYLLFQLVLHLVTGLLVLMVAIVTCCGCCLMLLPYLGTVLLLPVLVFHRAYSACYLAQYGPGFDVFTSSAPAS